MRTQATGMHLHMIGVLPIVEAHNWYTIVYIYDHGNVPIGMQYRLHTDTAFTTFWFEKNLHGDIVAVYSADGVKQLSYAYNAWGIPFSTTYVNGTKAHKNPFLYRGYYYEQYLTLYRTQTRIYDPHSGRFVSPDKYVSTGTGILGHNMYAYCNNNPVNFSDPSGELFGWIIAAVAIVTALVVGANVGTVIASELEVANSDVPAMDDETYKKIVDAQDTSGLSREERISYIRKVRENAPLDDDPKNDALVENWSEAAMLRELVYHDQGYQLVSALGMAETTVGIRLRFVDFETEQKPLTYVFRFLGNLMFW